MITTITCQLVACSANTLCLVLLAMVLVYLHVPFACYYEACAEHYMTLSLVEGLTAGNHFDSD